MKELKMKILVLMSSLLAALFGYTASAAACNDWYYVTVPPQDRIIPSCRQLENSCPGNCPPNNIRASSGVWGYYCYCSGPSLEPRIPTLSDNSARPRGPQDGDTRVAVMGGTHDMVAVFRAGGCLDTIRHVVVNAVVMEPLIHIGAHACPPVGTFLSVVITGTEVAGAVAVCVNGGYWHITYRRRPINPVIERR